LLKDIGMKQFFIGILCLSFMSLYSCDKKQAATEAAPTAQSVAHKYQGTGKVVDWGTWKCPAGDGNCIGPIIVHVPRNFDRMITAVSNGSFSGLLSDDIGVYNELTADADALALSYINGARDGRYHVALKTDAPKLNTNKAVLLFGSETVSNSTYDVLLPISR